jgi:hypothetical protein
VLRKVVLVTMQTYPLALLMGSICMTMACDTPCERYHDAAFYAGCATDDDCTYIDYSEVSLTTEAEEAREQFEQCRASQMRRGMYAVYYCSPDPTVACVESECVLVE